MKYFLLSLLVLYMPGLVQSQEGPLPENSMLREVLQEIDKFKKKEFSTDSAAGRVLGSFKPGDFKRRHDFYLNLDKKLRSLDSSRLSFSDQINLELLLYSFEDAISDYRYKAYLNPILSDGGFHTSLPFMASAVLQNRKEFDEYLKKLHDIPRYLNEHIELMRMGLASGIAQPRDMFKGYENTWNQHITEDAEKSVFWKPFQHKPSGLANEEWNLLTAAAKKAISEKVVPGYRSVKNFFENEYIPKAREQAGVSGFPDGPAYYQDRVNHFTTTALGYDEIYRIGLKEVERIQKSMQDVMREAGFTGTRQEFIATLRNDPKFYPETPEALLKEASFIAKKADGKLPLLFGKLPRQPYSVEPVPADLAPVYTGGRYSGAPIRSKRSGQYWVNTYNLKSRTLYTLEALTLHEAVPGHHLQISLTQELDHLPAFRRNLYVNAYGEGWGLYAEYLGYEMGFYQDPYSRFGQLTYDMWRACRLVIDVGLHAKGWTREQAVKYLAENTALSLHEVNTEINRYMAWPGQALAYKMGELKIRELRQKAETELGDKFDVRDFHDRLLSEGTVTLRIMEKMVNRFIAEKKQENRK